jgi:NADH dehydrogenase (ubiquinone) 1 alpha subcomplex subunit 8
MFQSARKEEKAFNDCVFEKLGLEKVIPGTPEGSTPIHLKEKPMLR